ncbi:MAG: DUF4340 domain-containing protein [Amaricoccus sp.]
MNRLAYALGALLVVQLGLALGLNHGRSGQLAGSPETAMFAFAAKDVDKLTIAGSGGDSVTLARADKGWNLPDADGFPATSDQVDALLGKLLALREGPPVATSKDAPARFRLTDDAHERRIVFEGGGKELGELYLGSGQGVRQVYARRADQDGVYQVDFASYEARTTPGDWMDKSIVQVPADQIAAIEVDGLRLERTKPAAQPAAATPAADTPAADTPTTPPTAASPAAQPATADAAPAAQPTPADAAPAGWALAAGTPPRPLNPPAVDALANALAGLRVDDVVGKADAAGYDVDNPVTAVALTMTDGSTRRFAIAKADGKDAYALTTSLRPSLLKLSDADAKQLVALATLDALLTPPAPAPAVPPAGPGGSG